MACDHERHVPHTKKCEPSCINIYDRFWYLVMHNTLENERMTVFVTTRREKTRLEAYKPMFELERRQIRILWTNDYSVFCALDTTDEIIVLFSDAVPLEFVTKVIGPLAFSAKRLLVRKRSPSSGEEEYITVTPSLSSWWITPPPMQQLK